MTDTFHDTRWTLVARSRGSDTQAKAALSELCEVYYAPVVAFLRRDGRVEDAARELAHEFFARLLEGGAIDGATPERGRFRTYLLAALKHFAADKRDRNFAAKRGGSLVHVPIEPEQDATAAGLQFPDTTTESPDAAFDRQWALTVLARALHRLEAELQIEGKAVQFDVLRPWLTADADTTTQNHAAETLGVTPDAVKMAVHRLRRRFREGVKHEIAQTLHAEGNVQEEMNHLLSALRGV